MATIEDVKTRMEAAEPAWAVKGAEGRRQLLNYTGAQQRTDNCKGCKLSRNEYLNTGSWNESVRLWCGVGDFPVAAGGVCEQWEKAK